MFAPFPIGNQWPTVDPFLFVAHHRDAYPAGNAELAPATSLAGRPLGNDFGDIDGWNMYHGSKVPGFPQHPHRGFETITFMREGFVDHSDSLGATARFGAGDTQWMTAGKGIVHCEMFPLLQSADSNPLEMFQIWLNLPGRDKMVDPYFTMLWSENTPRFSIANPSGAAVEVSVVAGSFDSNVGQPPPPDSWANKPEADVAVIHFKFSAGAEVEIPATASPAVTRTLYTFHGSGLEVSDAGSNNQLPNSSGVRLPDTAVSLRAGGEGAQALLLQGRPIAEPVAQYGPFVMNSRQEIEQAFSDYHRTQFGGWPWPSEAPVHAATEGRFAVHADGRREGPPSSATNS